MLPAAYRGVNAHPIWAPDTLIDQICAALAASSVQLIRIDIPMNYMFTLGQGRLHPGYLERLNRFMAECPAGIEVLVNVSYTPGWANGGQPYNIPWGSPQDFAAAVTQLVQAFPRAAAWEIWNEPDLNYSWAASTGTVERRAATYVQLLRAAYNAVKEVNPSLRVVAPAVSGAGCGPWLAAFYAANPHGFYDVFAAHMYGDPPSHGGLSAADTVQAWAADVWPIMAANGDGLAELWITETGWNTGQGGVTADQQAEMLTGIFGEVDAQVPQVRRLYWYEWNDDSATPTVAQAYGLNTFGMVPKPALAAFNGLP